MPNHPQCTGSGIYVSHLRDVVTSIICPDCRHHVRVDNGRIVKHWWSKRALHRHGGLKQ